MDAVDARILELLIERQFLTQEQARRVRKAMDRGRRLDEALSRVPLVEPLAFLRATRTAEEEDEAIANARPLAVHQERTVAEKRQRMDEHFEFLRADEDMDDEDVTRIPSPHFPSSTPRPRFQESTPLTAREMLRREREDSLHEAPTLPDAIDLATLPEFNLREDEGIPFLRDANAMMAELIELEGRGFRLRAAGLEGGEIRYYRANGRLAQARLLPGDQAARYLHRLKIMARLDPWKKTSSTGAFLVHYFTTRCCLMLDVAAPEDDGVELLTVFRM